MYTVVIVITAYPCCVVQTDTGLSTLTTILCKCFMTHSPMFHVKLIQQSKENKLPYHEKTINILYKEWKDMVHCS